MSAQNFSKQLNLLNNNIEFRKEEMFLYVKCLSNFTLLNLKLNNQKEITLGIEILKGIKTQNKQVQNYVNYMVYLFELMQFNLLQKFKTATEFIENNFVRITEIESWILQQDIMDTERSYVLFNSIIAFMNVGDYKKALKLLNGYLNNESKIFKDDVYNIALILNLFIHFELENEDLIEYNLKSVERHLKANKRMYDFEKTILVFIQNALKAKSKVELKARFRQLSIQFNKIKKTKFGKNVFEYFDFLAWVDKKCN